VGKTKKAMQTPDCSATSFATGYALSYANTNTAFEKLHRRANFA